VTSVRRRSYGSYAGPSIIGSEEFDGSGAQEHWDRVLWLTSMVESGGRFGSITMYDGTAVTAGLHQAVAVYPRALRYEDWNATDDQGSFWQLLRRLEMIPDFPTLQDLWTALAAKNWYLATDSTLRYLADATVKVKNRSKKVKAGDIVYGAEIREEFTPNAGKVPARGKAWEQSKAWALLFHAVFADPKSFKAQVSFGREHFEKVCRHRTLTVSGERKTVEDWVYGGQLEGFRAATDQLDLALAVWWSHSVNAPAEAYKIMKRALRSTTPDADPDKFSRLLLRYLAASKHGRWHFTEKSGRWQRTRSTAKKVWDSHLFNPGGAMPYRF